MSNAADERCSAFALGYTPCVRRPVDPPAVLRLLEALGRRARGPGGVYLTGGATALLLGWRTSTNDVDIKLDPEPDGVFEAIASLKNELDVNVELASPDLFIPELPGWRERSRFVGEFGKLQVFHYDLRAQALAKLARGVDRDLLDVRAMLDLGLVSRQDLRDAFEAIRTRLIRFPRLDEASFAAAVAHVCDQEGGTP